MNATYRKLTIVAITCIISLLLPQQTDAQIKHMGPSTSEKLAIKQSQKILDCLLNRDTSYPYSQFDKQMKSSLSEKELALVFSEIEKKCGKYQSSKNWEITKNGIYVIVTAEINFEIFSLQYLITFNMNDLIAGMYFKPLPQKE